MARAAKITRSTANPKTGPDALEARLAKLERANASLRKQAKEIERGSNEITERLSEVEGKLRAMAKRLPAKAKATPGRARGRRELDPGDAVPPGVAVQDPGPMDDEARAVKQQLDETLAPD